MDRPEIETCRSVLRVDNLRRPIPSEIAKDMVIHRVLGDVVKEYVSVKVQEIPDGALYIAEIEVVVPKKQEGEGSHETDIEPEAAPADNPV